MNQRIGITLDDAATARCLEHRAVVVDCVEIVADGFFARPSPYLTWLGSQFPLVVRATSLPSATAEPDLDLALHALTRICASAHPRVVSLPLAYLSVAGIRLPQALPAPLDAASRSICVAAIRAAQATLQSQLVIEPIAAPLRLTPAEDEPSLLAAIHRETGCGLLLDLSALIEDSRYHGYDPAAWLDGVPPPMIAGVRVAASGPRANQSDPTTSVLDDAALALLERLSLRHQPDLLILDPRGAELPIAALEDGMSALRHFHRRGAVRHSDPSAARTGDAARADAQGPARRRVDDAASPSLTNGGSITADEDTVDIAPGAALFVLDTAGVCFYAPSRELTLFNTAATYVWCLLEDGERPADIPDRLAETFGMPAAESERHVTEILREWFGRGYITRPGRFSPAPLPLLNGLAMLVANARLREAFGQNPGQVADLLSIAAENRAAFVAIDPVGLDALAVNPYLQSEPAAAAPPRAPVVASNLAREARRYRLVSTTFAISAERPDVRQALHEALGHLETTAAAADVTIDVGADGQVVEDGGSRFQVPRVDAVVPAVKQRVRALAVERHRSPLSVHAAVVAFGDDCVLLPAAAGSGKTTLTAALLAAGATYFSDEIALIADDTYRVVPVPLGLTVKDGSVAPLGTLYPEIAALGAHVREDHVRVRYLPPPLASLPVAGASAAARFLVFPRFAPDAGTALTPIDRPTALRRLLDESSLDHDALDRHRVEALVRWMRTLECFELPFASLADATRSVRALFATASSQ